MTTTMIPKKDAAPLAPTRPSALNIMAARMHVDPAKLFDSLKKTVFAKATDEELLALTVVANEYDLNPFLKEIYAFPAKGGGIVPIVSVDGWNKMLIREPDFDGIEFEFTEDAAGELVSCTATIHCKSRSHPVRITEYLVECRRKTDPWENMPRRMLRNRTLCQASRVAFGFSGVKNEDEALDIFASVETKADGSRLKAESETKQLPATPPPTEVKPEAGATVQKELETLLLTNGFTFDHLVKWGVESGNIEGADSFAGFDELPTDVCRRFLRAQSGLLKSLEKVAKA